ncbi:flagellar biosynthesis protein FlgF [Pseudoroseomonas deserti]|uniref:Flagellar biosynthesis protein FlgF n=1 Tax=Teichococcus deserti TaxID=1817963 RepID=A0A1V2H2R1_9PROT|nr:flagellar hook basal-body protein [Pseudoroseomonas deserti]ONG54046.1 flagellar biosynthesis protein FlgF [Pseudoroseomonas deserti]
MDSPSVVSLSGQLALRQQMEVVANNLANATSTGYRGDRTLFQSHVNRLAVPGREIAFVQDRATYIDTRQGEIGATGNPLDMAIDGEGFFAVERPGNAGRGYSRDGRFKMSAEGALVDSSGRAISGEGGARILLPERATSIEVRADGNVLATVEGRVEQVGRIGLFTAGDMRGVRKAGDGLMDIPANQLQPIDPTQPGTRTRLVQGALEASTIQPVQELANLTLVQRAYETMQRFIADDDQRMRRMIEMLGRPN